MTERSISQAPNGKVSQQSLDELQGMLYEFVTGPLGKKARGDGKAGEYTCSCPLPSHEGNDKNPSFSFNANDGLYFCHKEGKGGNVFDLAAEVYGLDRGRDFREVIERLSRDLGVTLEYEQGKPEDQALAERKVRAYRAMDYSQKLYAQALDATQAQIKQFKSESIPHSKWENEAAVFIDTELGLNASTLSEIGAGYAPTDPRFLYKRLAQKGDDALLGAIDAGLIKPTKRYKDSLKQPLIDNVTTEQLNNSAIWRDTFINRIVYPIRDFRNGSVCGYTARTTDSQGHGPKYINSNENIIYSKSSASAMLGLHEAMKGFDDWKHKTGKLKAIVLVEGPKDFAKAYACGVPAVCTNGIRLSDAQVKVLMRNTNELVIGYDNDSAGRDAKITVWENLLQHSDELRISQLVIPSEKKDPGEMNSKDFMDGLRNRMSPARAVASFVKDFSGYDQYLPSNEDKRLYALELSTRFLDAMPDSLQKADAINGISKLLGINPQSVLALEEGRTRVVSHNLKERDEQFIANPDNAQVAPPMPGF